MGARAFNGPKQEKLTVGELLDALEADYNLGGKLTPQVKSHLKPIRAAFGDRLAVALTAEQVDAYIQERLELGYAKGSINRGTKLLGRAFRLAIERRRLADMPYIRELDKSSNVRQGFFEREEFEAVVSHLPDVQDFVRFAHVAGWRKGEIAALLWASVDERTITLPADKSKNREARKVPLVGELKVIIARRWAARHYRNTAGISVLSPFVFHRERNPVRLHPPKVRVNADWRDDWRTFQIGGKLVVVSSCPSRKSKRCNPTSHPVASHHASNRS